MKFVVETITLRNEKETFRRIFGEGTMTYVHTRLHAYMSPYVPMETGMLDETVDITPKCVHYKVVYAHRQWDGKNFHFSKDQHPLATAHWEEAAMAAKKDDLCKDITDYLRRK